MYAYHLKMYIYTGMNMYVYNIYLYIDIYTYIYIYIYTCIYGFTCAHLFSHGL